MSNITLTILSLGVLTLLVGVPVVLWLRYKASQSAAREATEKAKPTWRDSQVEPDTQSGRI
jgi:hypothetical protein